MLENVAVGERMERSGMLVCEGIRCYDLVRVVMRWWSYNGGAGEWHATSASLYRTC